MKLPIRARLTIVYVVSAAIVQLAFGTVVYGLVRHDLTASVDLGLRSRAQTLVDEFTQGTPPNREAAGTLIDTDESFTQFIDGTGHALTLPTRADGPAVLDAGELAAVTGPRFFEKVV